MTFVHWLVIISAAISVGGGTTYIINTLRGKTKPNRVTWFLWALAPLVGVSAALSAHADIWVTSRPFMAGFMPLLVFIASFVNPKSYWKLSSFDIACGLCSVLALVVWVFARQPVPAVLLAALGDGFAALPTIRKAWKNPETETGLTYALGLVAALLVLPSIPKWDVQNSAFQIYLLAANSALVFSVYRKKIFSGGRQRAN